ncbi:MAG: hypothetical protein ACLQIB_52120 [Isosphaeraceae bacterium]
MRHQLHPSIDCLESKTLLSHVAASLVAVPVQHLGSLVEIEPSAMAVSLTTDQATYHPGQIATVTLTITNISNDAESIPIGPSRDGFYITHNDTIVWRSNAGPEPQFIVNRILQPGQSIILTATWTVAAQTGTFVAQNQLFPNGPTATFNVTKLTGTIMPH